MEINRLTTTLLSVSPSACLEECSSGRQAGHVWGMMILSTLLSGRNLSSSRGTDFTTSSKKASVKLTAFYQYFEVSAQHSIRVVHSYFGQLTADLERQ